MNMPFMDTVKLLNIPWGVAVFFGAGILILLMTRRLKSIRPKVTVRHANAQLIRTTLTQPEMKGKRGRWSRIDSKLIPALVLAGLLVLSFGSSNPAMARNVPTEQGTLCLILDVSNSMKWNDVEPTRIDAARQVIKETIIALPAHQQVMVVTFSGKDNVSVLIEPTLDRAEALARLDSVETGPNTAGGEAIYTTIESLKSQDNQLLPENLAEGDSIPVECVLLADGATDQGDTPEVAALAAAAFGLKIHTVSFGFESGNYQIDGVPTQVTPDPDALEEVARITDGKSYKDVGSAKELSEIIDSITSSLAMETNFESVGFIPTTLGSFMLIIGLCLGVLRRGLLYV